MVCSISNPDFVIYSSVVSFYLPFIVTLLVYIRIYIFLRMRRKRIAFGQASGKVQPGSTLPSVVRQLSWSCFLTPNLHYSVLICVQFLFLSENNDFCLMKPNTWTQTSRQQSFCVLATFGNKQKENCDKPYRLFAMFVVFFLEMC